MNAGSTHQTWWLNVFAFVYSQRIKLRNSNKQPIFLYSIQPENTETFNRTASGTGEAWFSTWNLIKAWIVVLSNSDIKPESTCDFSGPSHRRMIVNNIKIISFIFFNVSVFLKIILGWGSPIKIISSWKWFWWWWQPINPSIQDGPTCWFFEYV